jgi:hypothetical protein
MCSGLLLLLLSTVPTQGSQQQQHSIPSVRLALRITIEYGTIRETRQGQKRMVPETRKLVTNTWDDTSFEFNRYNLSHAVLCHASLCLRHAMHSEGNKKPGLVHHGRYQETNNEKQARARDCPLRLIQPQHLNAPHAAQHTTTGQLS